MILVLSMQLHFIPPWIIGFLFAASVSDVIYTLFQGYLDHWAINGYVGRLIADMMLLFIPGIMLIFNRTTRTIDSHASSESYSHRVPPWISSFLFIVVIVDSLRTFLQWFSGQYDTGVVWASILSDVTTFVIACAITFWNLRFGQRESYERLESGEL